MSRETELAVNRRNTLAFILANPSELNLIPVERIKTASGGTRLQDLPARTAQLLRLIDLNAVSGISSGIVLTTDGRQVKALFQLLGTYDCEMAVGDHWTGEGKEQFQVAEMLPFNGYERRGMVTRLGSSS